MNILKRTYVKCFRFRQFDVLNSSGKKLFGMWIIYWYCRPNLTTPKQLQGDGKLDRRNRIPSLLVFVEAHLYIVHTLNVFENSLDLFDSKIRFNISSMKTRPIEYINGNISFYRYVDWFRRFDFSVSTSLLLISSVQHFIANLPSRGLGFHLRSCF